MVNTTHSIPLPSPELIEFLQQKIGLSDKAIELGVRQSKIQQAPLPIVLWSFGLLDLSQYQKVLDWENDQ